MMCRGQKGVVPASQDLVPACGKAGGAGAGPVVTNSSAQGVRGGSVRLQDLIWPTEGPHTTHLVRGTKWFNPTALELSRLNRVELNCT